jgi:hypothetical protein
VSDLHLVIEGKQAEDGSWGYRAVTPALPWRLAQDTHQRFEMGISSVSEMRYFMVRSVDDPRWSYLVRPVARLRTFTRKTYIPARVKAAKDYAAAHGYFGRPGGWIYSWSGKPVAQGWEAFASLVASRHHGIRRVLLGEHPDQEMWFALPATFEPEPARLSVVR